MPTFTELLPPSLTQQHRVMKYTPACTGIGVLELEDAKTHVRYALAVQPFGGVRLTKQGGEETYVVTAATCECKGFVLGRRRCKHIDAVEALLSNDWLEMDDRATVGDPVTEAEEKDAHFGDDWENYRGPDRLADDWHARMLGGRLVHEPLGC